MAYSTSLSIYLSGAFSGICVLVLVLSLLVGYAYSERMLWWHAAALSVALLSQAVLQSDPRIAAGLWVIQLALAAHALCVAAGHTGAMRVAAVALRSLVLAFVVIGIPALALGLVSDKETSLLLLPWLLVMLWYVARAWQQNRPWIYWIAAGQLALASQYFLWLYALPGLTHLDSVSASLAALALYASMTYVGMVWASRLRSENALRVEARERTDPLTGLATQLVFFDRVEGAIIRSRNMGHDCAVLMVRVENIEQVVADQRVENNERVVLVASRAIAGTLRTQDSAARLAHNRFAVLAEGIAEGAATRLATRILANGLRASEWGLQGSELQFQIAIVEISRADVQPPAIFSYLEDVLRHMADHGSASRISMLPRIEGKHAGTG